MEKPARSVDIVFTDLTYIVDAPKTKDKKKILNSVSGTFKSGELTAIMGASGAGKSSLMNILTGFTKSGISGSIKFGNNIKNRKMCCYILQEDHFFPWFTVEEAMLLAATLKISNKSLSFKDKQLLIESILESLHLSKTRKTKCSNLSGGQKKRLSIAFELIDNPPVIFLDEPTTGLDSSASLDLVQLLKKLCNTGKTIICTIHQPSASIFSLFGHIYVLNRGYCVYQGSPSNTVPFLESIGLECPAYHNPADFLLEVTTGEYGDFTLPMAKEAVDKKWRKNSYEIETISINSTNEKLPLKKLDSNNSNHMYPPDEFFRLWILIGRCHVQFYRDWTTTHLKLFLHVCCAILMGLLYGDAGNNATKTFANLSLLMVSVLYLWYTTSMPGVLRFPTEIATIRKETFNNWYKLKTYYMATIITSTPVHIIYSATFSTIIYFMTNQPYELDRYGKFVLINIINTIAADGFGILIGTLAKPINGTFLGATLCCFMLIYSGFLIVYDHMSVVMKAISYISPQRYAFESLVLSVYADGRQDMPCPDDVIYCHFKSAKLILQNLGITADSNFNFNVLMILLQISLFKGVAYFTLRRALKKQ